MKMPPFTWAPIEEYFSKFSGNTTYIAYNPKFDKTRGFSYMPIFEDGMTDDDGYTHVLVLEGNLVMIPDTWSD